MWCRSSIAKAGCFTTSGSVGRRPVTSSFRQECSSITTTAFLWSTPSTGESRYFTILGKSWVLEAGVEKAGHSRLPPASNRDAAGTDAGRRHPRQPRSVFVWHLADQRRVVRGLPVLSRTAFRRRGKYPVVGADAVVADLFALHQHDGAEHRNAADGWRGE